MVTQRRVGGEVVITSDASRARAEMDKFTKGVQNTGKQVTAAGNAMTKYVTGPLAALGGAMGLATKITIDFENQVARVGAISGSTGQDLAKLERLARDMGSSTSFSATQAAQGLEYLAMAGWDVAEMMEGLPPILRMAEATQMDLARASDIVSDMMSAFRMEAAEVGRITDVLAKTSTTANTNVELLGETMKYAAPAAAAAGWSLESAAAAAGLFADSGIKGSMAGTTLNMMISDLTNLSEDAATEAKALGVAVFDAEGNMRSMVEIVRDLEKATKGMTDEQRMAFLNMLFGERSARGINILLAQGADRLEEYTKQLEAAEGAVEDMGKTMRDTLSYELKEMRSYMEDVAIELGQSLIPIIRQDAMPVVKDIAERVRGLVDWFASLDHETRKQYITWGLYVAAIGPVLVYTGKIITAFGTLIPLLKSLAVGFTALAGPAGWIALTAAALGGLVYAASQTREEFVLDIEKMVEESSTKFEQMEQELKEKAAAQVRGILDEYRDLHDQGTAYFTELYLKNTQLTEENRERIISEVEELKNGYLGMLETQYDEGVQAIAKGLELGLIEHDTYAELLTGKLAESKTTQQQIVEEGEAEILQILENAFKEQRELTKTELEQINEIRLEMYDALVAKTEKRVGSTIEIEEDLFRDLESLDYVELGKRRERIGKWAEEEIKAAEEAKKEELEVAASLYYEHGVITEEAYREMIGKTNERYEERTQIIAEKGNELNRELENQYKHQGEILENEVSWTTKALIKLFGDRHAAMIQDTWEATKDIIFFWRKTSDELVGHSIVPNMTRDVMRDMQRMSRDAVSQATSMQSGVVSRMSTMASDVISHVGSMVRNSISYFQDLYYQAVGHSIVPKMADEITAEFEKIDLKMGDTFAALREAGVAWDNTHTAQRPALQAAGSPGAQVNYIDVNMHGMFEGAVMHFRDETDLDMLAERITRKLYNLFHNRSRAEGVVF